MFRRSQLGRILRVLTLRQHENSSETTPAISSNYMQLQVPRKLHANNWIDVRISERENEIVGEIVDLVTAGAA
jgi:hypothetical protein